MTVRHELLGGKVQIYMRAKSPHWQCSASFDNRQYRATTKTESLAQAKDFAEDWYLDLRGKHKRGEVRGGKTFKQAAEKYEREYEIITAGERSPRYVQGHKDRLRVHLIPFFGKKAVAEITAGLVDEYRIHRLTSRKHPKTGEPMKPARTTMHHEIVCLRQVLKTAIRAGWIDHLPDLSAPYKGSGKIAHRGWFSPEEYKALYTATRARARKPKHPRWKRESEQLHDYVLFMANTGLRPDEAARLQFRDVRVVDDEASGERILEIEVRGKRGVGHCKSMPNAVRPFVRLRDREWPVATSSDQATTSEEAASKERQMARAKPTDKIFNCKQRDLLNTILDELELKFDRDGNRRTAYSLRHTYICMRLMEGADIYQIAKNCRTSVEMIEKYYASHLKNTLDAAAINVRKSHMKAQPIEDDEDAEAA